MCAQKLPFETNSLPLLALKIIKGSFPPINVGNFSRELKTLILNLLQVDQRKRPSIDSILQKPILFKYLPSEMQEKIKERTKAVKAIVKPPSGSFVPSPINTKTIKPKKKPKPKIS